MSVVFINSRGIMKVAKQIDFNSLKSRCYADICRGQNQEEIPALNIVIKSH